MDVLGELSPDVDVSHPDYSPTRIDPRRHVSGDYPYDGPIAINDIRLQKSR